ncbi:MAG: NAD(P)H-hydrate dehydratase, partial [Pseudomonadota bacterium]
GNNGGDAYVMARLALAEGKAVSVMAASDPERLSGDAKTAFGDYLDAGGALEPAGGPLPGGVDLLIDGLLGTGLEREVTGSYRALIEAMNGHTAPVLALDIPSGIAGDSGHALGAAVAAHSTIAFVGLKPAYFLADGIDCCGELYFAGLGIAADCYRPDRALLRRIPDEFRQAHLRPRPRNAHKGLFGHVLVVGGTAGMPGAALLAAQAALRSGAGSVTVATHPAHADSLVAACPELMVQGVDGEDELVLQLERASVVVLGPGLGLDAWSKKVYACVSADERTGDRPSVWDAGALTQLGAAPFPSDARVITPHPGEAAALLGSHAGAVQADRLAALSELRERYAGVAVLKGAATLVSSRDAVPYVSARGNPGMSTAGMGDVLTGVIAALAAQGLPLTVAASLGVDVHARAGDAAALGGERGMLAGDVVERLREAVNP